MSKLVKLTNSNIGALFVLDKNATSEDVLDMKGCYAYDRKKYLSQTFYLGEGLIGQAYLEKDNICLQEIPQEFSKISSGLGEIPPKNIFIVPVMDDEKVEGVIELASLEIYKPHQKELIEKVAERLASVLKNNKQSIITKSLLQESQKMTENMRASEEELRQNLEELEATQEELNRIGRESTSQMETANSRLAD
ncbi:GAF domain-containing protein [Chondrinema litorale]|uniref:GAF domain-containing protein n=1 Tax=Chondrinema litorale TaxID=2994555 RepID=UPI002543CD94|nr:GAF domain-containing protein [Chondrinema litorale]UZR96744.1 GAF domain-containing protein [Chondrinema litorale]